MIFIKNKITIIIIILINFFFISCGEIIKGRVAIKGNEPHTYISLVTEDGKEYQVVGKLKNKIAAEYQGNTIKIKGEVVQEGLAPGFPPSLKVTEIIGKIE